MCEVYMSMVVCEGVYGVCGVYIYECEHVYMCWCGPYTCTETILTHRTISPALD